jgi:hypothetical protein
MIGPVQQAFHIPPYMQAARIGKPEVCSLLHFTEKDVWISL